MCQNCIIRAAGGKPGDILISARGLKDIAVSTYKELLWVLRKYRSACIDAYITKPHHLGPTHSLKSGYFAKTTMTVNGPTMTERPR